MGLRIFLDERGISSIFGTIILVFIVVILVGGIGSVATGFNIPDDPPFLKLSLDETDQDAGNFCLYHEGGESVLMDDVTLKVDGSVLSDHAEVSSSGADGSLNPGERIKVDNYDLSGNTKVKVVHEPTNSLLAEFELDLSGGEGEIQWDVGKDPVFSGTNRAYYSTVLKIEETYHMWYTDKESGDYVIKRTTSSDGKSWDNLAKCTELSGLPNHSVVVNTGTDNSPSYRIWYSDASKWPYDENSFRTAVSTDGINWENDTRCENLFEGGTSGEWYSSYGPGDVLYDRNGYDEVSHSDPMGNKFVMYYDIATMNIYPSQTEVTALAYSADGVHWYRYGDEPIIQTGESGAWDDNYVYVRSVVEKGDGYEAWYSGGADSSHEGIGHLTSSDGIHWSRDDRNPILHRDDSDAPEWRNERSYTPSVIRDEGVYKMWFSGDYVIGYASR